MFWYDVRVLKQRRRCCSPMLRFASETGGFTIMSVVTAVIGACVLLFVLGLIQKGRANV